VSVRVVRRVRVPVVRVVTVMRRVVGRVRVVRVMRRVVGRVRVQVVRVAMIAVPVEMIAKRSSSVR
jgi:hypothetical protein